MGRWLESFWQIQAQGSSVPTEIRAGLTTFLTMAYILFVNPMILGKAIQVDGATEQILTATALAAAIGSIMMGLLARYPFALAPGMGINAYFTYTVCRGQGIPWQTALGAVFISGLLFILLSVAGIRELIINAIPRSIKTATSAGIGLFLAFIGCQAAGLVADHPVTLVTLGELGNAKILLSLFGLLATTSLLALRVRGAILIGIAATTVLAIVSGAPVFGDAAFAGFEHGILRPPAWPTDLFLSTLPVPCSASRSARASPTPPATCPAPDRLFSPTPSPPRSAPCSAPAAPRPISSRPPASRTAARPA
jgi:AGZA family xanthine/uracil permease-like MFS transporter